MSRIISDSGLHSSSSVGIAGLGAAKVSVSCAASQQIAPSLTPDISCSFKGITHHQVRPLKSPASSEESDSSITREEKKLIVPSNNDQTSNVVKGRVIPIVTESISDGENGYEKTRVQSIPIRKQFTEQLMIRNSRIEEMGPQKTRTSPTGWSDYRKCATTNDQKPPISEKRENVTVKIVPVIETAPRIGIGYDPTKRSLEDVSSDVSLENLTYSDSSSQDPDSVNDCCRESNYSASEHDSTRDSHSSVDALDEPDTEMTTVAASGSRSSTLCNIPPTNVIKGMNCMPHIPYIDISIVVHS